MRKFIIDTDTGSDDAVALLLAGITKMNVVGVTTLCGNAPLEQATLNALMCMEVAGINAPLYKGAKQPLVKTLSTASTVHGKDGMGDCDLVHPKTKPCDGHAAEFILQTVAEYPDEIEIIALGPATNIALAIMKDRETMKNVKRIWSMGSAGFGPGNATPVAEFNVYTDAEAYSVMLSSGIPVTIIGFDMCGGDSVLNEAEIEELRNGSDISKFAADCTGALVRHYKNKHGVSKLELPDPVAIAAAIWDDVVEEAPECYCYCCTADPYTYGQVIVYERGRVYSFGPDDKECNCRVVKRMDAAKMKRRMIDLLVKG